MTTKPLEVTGTLDIETQDWDKFVLGGILTPDGFEAFKWDEEDDYIDFLLTCRGTYWGFNAGRYDFLHVLEHFRRRQIDDVQCFCAGQRITYIRYKDLILRDAAALSGPMNLRQFSEIGTHRKSATGLSCLCGHCEDKDNGYCRIKIGMPRSELDVLTAYLYDDCESLKSGLETLFEFATAHNFTLKGTIGASAFATIQAWSGIPSAEWSRSKDLAQYRLVRAGYYGGRTQMFQPGMCLDSSGKPTDPDACANHRGPKHGYRYDINSAYPAALASLDLPTGKMARVTGRAAGRVFAKGRAGIYQARMFVPSSMFIPPLPLRTPERVSYPTGTFEGSWSKYEIDYAVECGATIMSFGDAFTWHESKPVLRPFCEKVWTLRDQAGPKSGLGRWLKNFGNSASGKLAQRPDVDELLLGPTEIQDECEPIYGACQGTNCDRHLERGCCNYTCGRACGVMLPVGGSLWVYIRKKIRMPAAGYIHWAAYLTAHARVELHRQLVSDGRGGRTAIYCDTDSCYSTTPRLRRIDEHKLGYWKYEGELWHWNGIAPKTYGYHAPDEKKGGVMTFHARSKGIPGAKENFDKILSGAPVSINRGVLAIRSAARAGGLFVRKNLERIVHADGIHFGDRVLGDDGRTYPPLIGDEKYSKKKTA